jgi:hypothetical protein
VSVTTRTNLATNPSAATTATNYAAVAGTGGTASVAWNSGAGYLSIPGFPRVTWTVATTAVSGGISYTQTGLSAATQYATQIWVRCSKAQTLQLKVDFRNSSNTIVNTITGSSVAVTASTWTQLTVIGTSGAAVTNAVFTAQAVSGGSNWANGDWLDGEAILIEATSTVGTYFDGSFTNAAGNVYAWTGTANASTSTDTVYQPFITLTPGTSPSPNVSVQYQDFDTVGTGDLINVWRTVDGKRRPVRGARRRYVVGSDFVVDYEAALGRTVSYDIEVLSGVCAGVVITTATITLSSTSGWLSDPLQPGTAIPVYADVGPNGEPGLDWDALAQFEYKSAVTELIVAGTDEPVALVGKRQSAGNVAFHVTTLATVQTNALRVLLKQANVVLFRPLAGWASALPGLCYITAASILEIPVNEKLGGQQVEWQAKSDFIAPPAANIVAPTTTYGTVSGNYATYSAFNAAHSGQTYLLLIQNP